MILTGNECAKLMQFTKTQNNDFFFTTTFKYH